MSPGGRKALDNLMQEWGPDDVLRTMFDLMMRDSKDIRGDAAVESGRDRETLLRDAECMRKAAMAVNTACAKVGDYLNGLD